MQDKRMLIVVLALLVAPIGLSSNVGAVQVEEEKVRICHRTDSVKNPYVSITVDRSAVDGVAGNSGNQADHFGEHKGPIATSEAVAQEYKNAGTEWGDIIPPVLPEHNGLNFTAEGQAIYNNDCNYVTTTTPPPPPSGEKLTPAQTTNPTAPTAPKTTPQLQTVPTQGVNAGGGGSTGSAAPSLYALLASVLTMGYGVFRIRKFNI